MLLSSGCSANCTRVPDARSHGSSRSVLRPVKRLLMSSAIVGSTW